MNLDTFEFLKKHTQKISGYYFKKRISVKIS